MSTTRVFHRHLHNTPPIAVSGRGVWLTDSSGKQYLGGVWLTQGLRMRTRAVPA